MSKVNDKINQTEKNHFFFRESNLRGLKHYRNFAMRFLCVVEIIVQMAVSLSAEDSRAYSLAPNLLKNGGFESEIANWRYYRGKVSGKYEIVKPGRNGGQCLHLQSNQPGYHGGASQKIKLKGQRLTNYRLG